MAQDPLNLLCVEPRFPGRLGAVADWLVRRRGYRCWFYCHQADPAEHWPEATGRGLDVVAFPVGGVAREASVAWTRQLERGLCYAYGCWEVLDARRPRPVDLVLGRSAGQGSTLFVPASLPGTPIVNLFDYFYHPHANDLADEDGPAMPSEYVHWRRSANAMDLLDLENGVIPWTTSGWQRDLYPPEYRADFVVRHDGVDARKVSRTSAGPRTIAGRTIPPGTKVVTFVSRFLDRLRGFDRFLELANRLIREDPDVLAVAAGGTPVLRAPDVRFYGQDYAAHLLAQSPPSDPGRLWRLGTASPAVVGQVLAASDLHVYPSRPYVASRSLLEAMAAGGVVLGWETEPAREFLEDGQTGLLVPPGDPDAAAQKARDVLADPAAYRPLGEAAAARIRERYARDVTLPELASWFDRLRAEGR